MAGRMHPDWDDAQNIREPLTIAFVVVKLELNFLLILDGMSQALYGNFVHGRRGLGTSRAARTRLLQEAAVAPQHLALGVTCELTEGV